ncbi:MAG: hypothetical protein ACJAQT_001610 [Akkermansiaceae bacterium]
MVKARDERAKRSFMVRLDFEIQEGRLKFFGVLFYLGVEAEDDFRSYGGEVGGVDLPLESVIFLAVDQGEAEEFVAEGGDADDASASVGEVGFGAVVLAGEMGTGEEEGVVRELGGGFVSFDDEVGERAFGLPAGLVGGDKGDGNRAAFWGEVDPVLVVTFPNQLAHGRVSGFGSEEEEGGVNVAWFCLNGDDGLVFFGVFETGYEFEGTFIEADGGLDINRAFFEVDGDAGEFEGGEGICLFFLFFGRERRKQEEEEKDGRESSLRHWKRGKSGRRGWIWVRYVDEIRRSRASLYGVGAFV